MLLGKKNANTNDVLMEGRPYLSLANAIVYAAVNDYLHGIIDDMQFKNFCYGQWFNMLTDMDGSYLFKLCEREKHGHTFYARKGSKARN
jgi:hypothetical protein